MIKIKQKGLLREYLKNEGYDIIIFWPNGKWNLVSTGYGGEQDGNDPIARINRVYNYDLTRKQIDELIKKTEQDINDRV